MTSCDLRELVLNCEQDKDWDFANDVLYQLCMKYPLHDKPEQIIAKVWLIGRSYAAAIERGRKKDGNESENYYAKRVAPEIMGSGIDYWIKNVTGVEGSLRVHGQVVELFREISGKENRSLASKYLHFHKPDVFFIYDSRAKDASKKICRELGITPDRLPVPDSDPEYRRFVGRCLAIQKIFQEDFPQIMMTPRGLDKLFLRYFASEKHGECNDT